MKESAFAFDADSAYHKTEIKSSKNKTLGENEILPYLDSISKRSNEIIKMKANIRKSINLMRKHSVYIYG